MNFERPDTMLSFLDIKAGDRFALGEVTMTRDEIIEFAAKYDPQPFHLSDEAARQSPIFTGLSASGWHSMLILQRMIGTFWESTHVRGLAGAGMTDLKWHAPVYPGDRLFGEMSIEAVRQSRTKPDLGIMTMRAAMMRQGEAVTSFVISGMFAVG